MQRLTACLTLMLISSASGFGQDVSGRTVALKHMTINGTDLAYVDQGRGQPVILVHGGLGDYRTWAAQMKPFSKSYRVIAYSRRYHFPNEWQGAGSDYSLALHAADLTKFIEALGLGAVHLIGHSYGGAVAAIAAAKHPELIRSLILIEPRLPLLLPKTPEADAYFAERREVTRRIIELLRAGHRGQAVRAFLTFTRGPASVERVSESVIEIMEDNVRTLNPMLAAVEPPNTFTCEDARKISAPALLVKGELSPKVYEPLLSQLEGCLQKSERVMVSGSSHGVMQENPKDFNRVVLKFLKRHEK